MEDDGKGILWGVLFGALGGLSLLWWIEEPFFFTGETIVLGGIVGGIVGYLWGHEIVAFIGEFLWPW